MYCLKCGNKLRDDANFCDYCGAGVENLKAKEDADFVKSDMPQALPKQKVKAYGVAGFVIAVVSILCFIIPIIGLFFAILAVVLSLCGLSRAKRNGCAEGLSIAGLVIGVIFTIIALLYNHYVFTDYPSDNQVVFDSYSDVMISDSQETEVGFIQNDGVTDDQNLASDKVDWLQLYEDKKVDVLSVSAETLYAYGEYYVGKTVYTACTVSSKSGNTLKARTDNNDSGFASFVLSFEDSDEIQGYGKSDVITVVGEVTSVADRKVVHIDNCHIVSDGTAAKAVQETLNSSAEDVLHFADTTDASTPTVTSSPDVTSAPDTTSVTTTETTTTTTKTTTTAKPATTATSKATASSSTASTITETNIYYGNGVTITADSIEIGSKQTTFTFVLNNSSSEDYSIAAHSYSVNGLMAGENLYGFNSVDVPTGKKAKLSIKIDNSWLTENGISQIKSIEIIFWAYADGHKQWDTDLVSAHTNLYTGTDTFEPSGTKVYSDSYITVWCDGLTFTVYNNTNYNCEFTVDNSSVNGWGYELTSYWIYDLYSKPIHRYSYAVFDFPIDDDFKEEYSINKVTDVEFDITLKDDYYTSFMDIWKYTTGKISAHYN